MQIVGKGTNKLVLPPTRGRTKILGNDICILDTRMLGIDVGETVASAQGMRGISAGRGRFTKGRGLGEDKSGEQPKGVGGEWE